MSSPYISVSVPTALHIPAICLCQREQALCRLVWGSFRVAGEGGTRHGWQTWGFCTRLMLWASLFACSSYWKDNTIIEPEFCLGSCQRWWLIPGGKWGGHVRLKGFWNRILCCREPQWACTWAFGWLLLTESHNPRTEEPSLKIIGDRFNAGKRKYFSCAAGREFLEVFATGGLWKQLVSNVPKEIELVIH